MGRRRRPGVGAAAFVGIVIMNQAYPEGRKGSRDSQSRAQLVATEFAVGHYDNMTELYV